MITYDWNIGSHSLVDSNGVRVGNTGRFDLGAIGVRLKRLRESQGFTQGQLAQLVRCNPQTISNIEVGKRAVLMKNMSMIARKLNCDLLWLLEGDESDKAPDMLANFQNSDTIGLRVRAARRLRKMSQLELAEAIGKPQPKISYLEKHARKLDSEEAFLIGEVLGVNGEWILSGEGPMITPEQIEASKEEIEAWRLKVYCAILGQDSPELQRYFGYGEINA